MRKLLIFDLDDTIFETKSTGRSPFKDILNKYTIELIPFYGKTKAQKLISDLWKMPFDEVAIKYELASDLQLSFKSLIQRQDYLFTIKAFPDFELIPKLYHSMIILTTGFQKLQEYKIHALGIRHYFDKIYIDEPLSNKRLHKFGFLKRIQLRYKDYQLIVIGDHINSEIKAGIQLGIPTIQMAHFQQEECKDADYYCQNFKELFTCLTEVF